MESAFLYFNAKNRQSHIPDEVLLPQNEPDINAVLARRNAIDVRRTHYPITYDFAGMSIFPYCADIPEEENDRGSVVHYQRLQVKTMRFAVNSFLSRVRMGLRRFLTGADHPTKLEEASKPSTLVPHQHTAYSYFDAQTDPFALYSSFYTLNKWELPAVARRWRQDAEFARQMMGGLDPTFLTRVTFDNYADTFLLPNFNVERQQALLPPGTTINSLIEQNRLYGITMPQLTGYPAGVNKHVCDPIVLLWVNDRKVLMPLAIQLTQTPKPTARESSRYSTRPTTPRSSSRQPSTQTPVSPFDVSPPPHGSHQHVLPPHPSAPSQNHSTAASVNPAVFTPLDAPAVWLLAKMHVQCSIVTYHSVCTHLVYCHLVSETAYISMSRHLSVRHPIHAMLRPHFWYLLKLNNQARELLASPTGILATLFGLKGVLFAVGSALKDRDMRKHMHFPNHLQMRGITPEATKEAFPDFHFRDDGLRMWAIYEEYVRGIVHAVYPSDDDLSLDMELQAWIRDLSSPWPHGVGLENLPVDSNGEVHDAEQLVELLTMILFNASVKHSAVNDPQAEYVTFIPNQPMYLTIPPPLHNDMPHITEAFIAQHLPNTKDSLLQMTLCMNITQLGFESVQTMLNMQSPFPASAGGLQKVFARFKDALKMFSAEVQERNAQIDFPYAYMDPRTITQSINM